MTASVRSPPSAPLAWAALVLFACLPPPAAAEPQRVEFAGLVGEIPAEWSAEPPGSPMRAIEVRVPGPPEARIIAYYFGPGQGGTAAANIARWAGQFSDAGGGPVEPEVTRFTSASMPVTLARYQGRYARGIGMGPVGAAKPDQALHAAVVEAPQGNVIIQLFGDRATVSAEAARFETFVGELRR